MTKLTEHQYQELKDVIIKANPEIVELKFGCAFMYKNTKWKFLRMHEGKYILMDVLLWRPVELKDEIFDVFENLDSLENLGRDITLCDVLISIRHFSNTSILVDPCGALIEGHSNGRPIILALWNLKKPLDEQSDETKLFLYQLLCSQ